MMHDGFFGGGGMLLLAGLVGFLMLFAVAGAIVLVVSRVEKTGTPRGASSAIAAASRRYAAGEISRDEYLCIKKDVS